jgi:hypothetical protein
MNATVGNQTLDLTRMDKILKGQNNLYTKVTMQSSGALCDPTVVLPPGTIWPLTHLNYIHFSGVLCLK